MIIWEPSEANLSAVARPIHFEPPVTTVILFSNLFDIGYYMVTNKNNKYESVHDTEVPWIEN